MHDGYKSEESLETVIKHFKLPDAKYAPYAFWFFDQSPATVGAKAQEMAHELAKHGFNPGYAHARVNYAHEAYPDDREIFPITKKEWLSDEWFRLFSEQLSQAGSDGCHFSFTDDFDWPSLQVGKKLVEEDPSLKAKSLWYTYFDAAKGETVRFERGFFAVVGKKAAEEQVPFVELCGKSDGVWKQRRYYCDQTPPAGNYSVPLNMASAYSEAKNCRADYHFYLPQGGEYTLFACWENMGANTDRATYSLADKTVTADQRGRFCVWNELGTFSLPAGANTVTVQNAGQGVLSVDGIKLTAEDGKELILDELQAINRTVAYLDFDSLHLLEDASYTAPYDSRIYVFTLGEHGGYDSSTVNYLDERLADLFYEKAWKPYWERYADQIGAGRTLNGIFSDHEGDYGYKLAWSDHFKDRFQAKYGEDLRRILPLMIDREYTGKEAVWRFRWFDTVSDIYVSQFRNLSDKAAAKGLYYTFHTWEETLPLQAFCVGDVFKLNRVISLPGTDALHNVCFNPQNFKDIFSVAEFEGRRMMDEVMALTPAEDYTPDLLKAQANYLALYGVSHVITHSVKMTRKHAQSLVPPDFYNIDPCWRAMDCYASFLRRTSYLNSLGKAEADLLIVNPLDSMYVLAEHDVFTMNYIFLGMHDIGAAFGGEAGETDRQYGRLIRLLTGRRLDFLSADKEYLNRMTVSGGRLQYNGYAFRTVILPRCSALDKAVARKLLAFAADGGELNIIGQFPTTSLQAGRNDPELAEIKARLSELGNVHIVSSPEELEIRSDAVFDGGEGLLMSRRRIDGRHFVFLCNPRNTAVHTAAFFPHSTGSAFLLHPDSGEQTPVSFTKQDGGIAVQLDFAPLEAYYLVLDPLSTECLPPRRREEKRTVSFRTFTVYAEQEADTLSPLLKWEPIETDCLRLILRKGGYADPDVIAVESVEAICQGAVFAKTETKKIFHTAYDEAASLTLRFPRHAVDAVRVRTQSGLTSFRVEATTETDRETVADYNAYYRSETIRPVAYPAGEYQTELTDWSEWPFLPERFAGILTYHTAFSLTPEDVSGAATLHIGPFTGSAEVLINGHRAGIKLFAPFDYEIGEWLKAGENQLQIRVSNTIGSNLTGTKGGIKTVELKLYDQDEFPFYPSKTKRGTSI